MKKYIQIFFIVLLFNINSISANATSIIRDTISKDQITISNLIYNPLRKELCGITPHGYILIIEPNKKKIIDKITLGDKNELYDYDIVSAIDSTSGFIYISFNRTLYIIDASTNKIKNEISLINNPDKIIPKNGSNKIWIFYSDLGLIGSIENVSENHSDKDQIQYERYVKRPSEVIYDNFNDKLYLINSNLKHIYSIDKNNKIIATLDYRKQIKLVKEKSSTGSAEEISIKQLKPGWREKQFSLDESTGKLFIPLDDSFLVFNTRNNSFENSIENVSPYKNVFTFDGQIILFFEIGNSGYHGLVTVDEKRRSILDVCILDKIEKITLDKENKKLYAINSFSELNYSSLITVDLLELNTNKRTCLRQFDKLINEIETISLASKDFRIIDFYKKIKPDIEKIKTCSSSLGESINDNIRFHLKRFISPCYSPTDRTKSCLIYYRLTEIINYLDALIALDINQNNISDICEK